MTDSPRCWLEISRGAFARNVQHAKKTLTDGARLMVAVKSNAYGHGGADLAAIAVESGADALAVLDVETGLAIRERVPDAPLLCWLLSPHSNFRAAVDANLTLGISHLWQLALLDESDAPAPVTVHLKVDTGLHRNGCLVEHFPNLAKKARELEQAGVIRVEGIWSHLADTSISEDRKSLDRFQAAVSIARAEGLSPTIVHIAASAAATDLPESRLDLVRIGISAYGVSPFEDRSAEDMGFTPVMVAKTVVVDATADGRTTLGMGWADGLLPLPADVGWLHHEAAVGKIERVDRHSLSVVWPVDAQPSLGETITLFGDRLGGSPRAEDWALWADTIGDEVVASMPGALHRIFVD